MKVMLAGVLQFYEGLALEKRLGGTGEYFIKNGNLATRVHYEDVLSRGVKDANFWRGGRQGIGYKTP